MRSHRHRRGRDSLLAAPATAEECYEAEHRAQKRRATGGRADDGDQGQPGVLLVRVRVRVRVMVRVRVRIG